MAKRVVGGVGFIADRIDLHRDYASERQTDGLTNNLMDFGLVFAPGCQPSFARVRGATGGLCDAAQEIAQLAALDVPELGQRWPGLLGGTAPPNLGRKMTIQAIAYRLQEPTFGCLKRSTLRVLDRAAGGSLEPKRARAKGRSGWPQ